MDEVRTEQQSGAGPQLEREVIVALGWECLDGLVNRNWHRHAGAFDPAVPQFAVVDAAVYRRVSSNRWEDFHPSRDIAAAFQVVEAMRAKVVSFEITWHSGQTRARTVRTTAVGERKPRDFIVTDEVRPAEPYWEAIVLTASPEHYGSWSRRLTAKADTPALAICLAALAALDASTPLSGEDSNG